MKLKVNVYKVDEQFSFDVVDTDDILRIGDNVYPELIYSEGRRYARIETAERNGQQWVRDHRDKISKMPKL